MLICIIENKDHKFHRENKLGFTTVITFYAATVFPFSLNISSISINLSRAPWLIMLLCSTLAIWCATVFKRKNTWLVSIWTTTLDDKKVILMVLFPLHKYQLLFITVTDKRLMSKLHILILYYKNKKQMVKKFWGRIFDFACLKFAMVALV